jgi:ABC-2 type transport system permease protein
MISIFKKEINNFLTSLTGHLVILIFLILNGLFLWVFPGSFNILDSGYSGLDGFFFLAPWIFLFLIPALTMRFFSDELKTGTIELLLTKPITELKLVLAKYLAGICLCIIALTTTLIYCVSIYYLGQPQGNMDWAAISGSYFGLLLLASVYVSIGVFTSSLSDNQIVSFILALFLSFFIYIGFDLLSSMFIHTGLELQINKLGLNYHYEAISRGVLDSRDFIYFISLSAVFIFASKLSIESRKW